MPPPEGGFKRRLAVADSGSAAHAVLPAVFDFRVTGRALQRPLALPAMGTEINLPPYRERAAAVQADFRRVRVGSVRCRASVECHLIPG